MTIKEVILKSVRDATLTEAINVWINRNKITDIGIPVKDILDIIYNKLTNEFKLDDEGIELLCRLQ